jgi:hypothetical protein
MVLCGLQKENGHYCLNMWSEILLNEILLFIKSVTIPYKKLFINYRLKTKNSMALVGERTIPTERPPPVGEVSANFYRHHLVKAIYGMNPFMF